MVDEGERVEVVLHGRHVLLLAAGVRVEDLPDGGRQAHVHGQRHQVGDVDEDALLEPGIVTLGRKSNTSEFSRVVSKVTVWLLSLVC